MINIMEVTETNKMVEKENLDVRTITMGINLLDCAGPDLAEVNEKIYNKITTLAKDLVSTGEEIAKEFGVPIVNKRISITPISLVGSSACKTPEDYVTIAKTLDKAAHTVGVNFIGGYSAVVSKGMTKSDELLIRSIPQALAQTELICSSVNVGSTKTGINMDAVRLMGQIVKETAEKTKDADSLGCAKLVVLCNAPDDNPFMAGAFHGVSEDDAIINVGVSGPGVVKYALESVRGESFEVLCETIKKTAFKITRVGQLVAQEASKRLGSSGAYTSVADVLFGEENANAYYLEFDDERSGGFEPLAKISGNKKVVLGLITTKSPVLEDKAQVIARIHEAEKFAPLDRLYLSPQCGFASCEIGNKLTEDEQWAKLKLVKEIAEEVWGK